MKRRIRVLLTKPTQDCHDRGVRYLMRMLRDQGFEVIFTNFLIAEEILSSALQEDVDVIGISSSSGGHMPVFEDLLAGMRKQGSTMFCWSVEASFRRATSAHSKSGASRRYSDPGRRART